MHYIILQDVMLGEMGEYRKIGQRLMNRISRQVSLVVDIHMIRGWRESGQEES